jgi:hypothetical protein
LLCMQPHAWCCQFQGTAPLLAGGVGGVEPATACPPSSLNLRRHLRLCAQRCTAAETLRPCVATHSRYSTQHCSCCFACRRPLLCMHPHAWCCQLSVYSTQRCCCSAAAAPAVDLQETSLVRSSSCA